VFSAHAHLNPGVLSLILSPSQLNCPRNYNSVRLDSAGQGSSRAREHHGRDVFQSCIPVALAWRFRHGILPIRNCWQNSSRSAIGGDLFINLRDSELGTPTLMIGGAAYAIFLIGLGYSRPLNLFARTRCLMRLRGCTSKYADRDDHLPGISSQFYSNACCSAIPPIPAWVASRWRRKTEIDVYKRLSGNLTRERRPFGLFALVENVACSRDSSAARNAPLDAISVYKVLVTFNSLDALEAIKRHLRNVTSQAPNAPMPHIWCSPIRSSSI